MQRTYSATNASPAENSMECFSASRSMLIAEYPTETRSPQSRRRSRVAVPLVILIRTTLIAWIQRTFSRPYPQHYCPLTHYSMDHCDAQNGILPAVLRHPTNVPQDHRVRRADGTVSSGRRRRRRCPEESIRPMDDPVRDAAPAIRATANCRLVTEDCGVPPSAVGTAAADDADPGGA